MVAGIHSKGLPAIGKVRRRWLWLTADVAAHGGILAWLLLSGMQPSVPVKRGGSVLTVFDVPAPQASASGGGRPAPSHVQRPPDPVAAPLAKTAETPPPLSLEQQVAAIIGDRAQDALAIPTEQSFTGLVAAGCDLTAPVEAALRTDPLALAAASRLPPATLSIANAYMLWDAGWIEPRTMAAREDLDPIRAVIAAQIALASPQCLAEHQMGPRLIVLGSTSSPVTLVIGSGEWTWGELSAPTPPEKIDRQNGGWSIW